MKKERVKVILAFLAGLNLCLAMVLGTSNLLYAGAFIDSGQSLGSYNTTALVLGDIDGDSDLDLITANDNHAGKVYVNNGSGTFTDSGNDLDLPNAYTVIALGDVDGDSDLDLVSATYNGAKKVFLNDGSGAFTDSGNDLGVSNSLVLALGDIDNDGDLDLVIGNYGQDSRIYLNDGTGTFTDSGQGLGLYETYGLDLGDVDGDGDLDLIMGNYDSGDDRGTRVYINDGNGIFTDSGQSLSALSHKYGDVLLICGTMRLCAQ